MGKRGKSAIGAVAASAIAMGILVATPAMAQAACLGNHPVSQHANTAVNRHLNAHVNQYMNIHANQHENVHLNQHVNEHLTQHVNVHINSHINVHSNDNVISHATSHVNIHVNDHISVHTQANEHLNLHVNEHFNGQLSQAGESLLLALKTLQVNHVDYLYSYFENVHLTQTQLTEVSTCANKVITLCKGRTDLSELSLTERQEVWQLLVQTFTSCGLTVSVHDHAGHTVNIVDEQPGTAVYVTVSDDTGHQLSTIPLKSSSSARSFTSTAEALENASTASSKLSDSDTSNSTVTGKLPQTATHDPLLIALGILLAVLGGGWLVLSRRFSKPS